MSSSVDHAGVWRLAAPMIGSNVAIALLGLVDTAVVGHLDEPYYLASIAAGAVIMNMIYWSMGFLRMSTTGLTAQVHGRNDHTACRRVLAQSLLIALLIATVILLLQGIVIDVALWFLQGSDSVAHYTATYFNWVIWGAPAMLVSLVLTGWLLGMQNAVATLYIAVAVNVLNIILDFVFVFGLNMDVRGVALASVISVYSGVLLAAILVRNELRRRAGQWLSADILQLGSLRAVFNLNQDIFIRTICLVFVFAFFTRQGARQGDEFLAANAVLLNFQLLLALALDGFANAIEALTGKAHGGRDRAAFMGSLKAAVFWSVLIALGFMVAYGFAGRGLINMLTDLTAVRQLAYQYLPWLVLSPAIAVWCFMLDGLFVGATRARDMRNAMIVSTFVVFLPLWWLFQGLGNHGLWLAFMMFFAARGITLAYIFVHIERGPGFVAR